jgi:hypothetical protein
MRKNREEAVAHRVIDLAAALEELRAERGVETIERVDGIAGRAMFAAVENDNAAGGTPRHAAARVSQRDAVGDAELKERLA